MLGLTTRLKCCVCTCCPILEIASSDTTLHVFIGAGVEFKITYFAMTFHTNARNFQEVLQIAQILKLIGAPVKLRLHGQKCQNRAPPQRQLSQTPPQSIKVTNFSK